MHPVTTEILGGSLGDVAPQYVERRPLVEIRNLRRARRQADAVFELVVPEFAVRRGEFVAITGASGCGKSTLLDILALILRPDASDSFRFADGDEWRDVQALWQNNSEVALAGLRRSRLGYVLQTGGLLPFLSIAQNVALPARFNNILLSAAQIRAAAEDIGIAGILNKRPQFVSGGQRQRAAILRAVLHRPSLILADEPTAAVDPERAEAIVSDFRRAAQRTDCAVVVVTHDRDLIEPVADKVYAFRLSSQSATETRSECILERGR